MLVRAEVLHFCAQLRAHTFKIIFKYAARKVFYFLRAEDAQAARSLILLKRFLAPLKIRLEYSDETLILRRNFFQNALKVFLLDLW